MAIVLTDNANYAAIAGAIRAKTGSAATYKPREMAAAIDAIVPYDGRCPRSEQEAVYVNAAGALSWDSAAAIAIEVEKKEV